MERLKVRGDFVIFFNERYLCFPDFMGEVGIERCLFVDNLVKRCSKFGDAMRSL